MVIFVNSGIVHFPTQKIRVLERVLLKAGHISAEINSVELIRDEARIFLRMYKDEAPIWYETLFTRDEFKQYLKVAECTANKKGHLALRNYTPQCQICDYCGTQVIEAETYVGCD